MQRSESGHRQRGESGLVQRVRARLAELPVTGPPSIVVGVSGGLDSLALAGVLADLSRQRLASVVAVHVDHGLRPESDREQRHVADQVRLIGLEFMGARIEPGVRDRHPGVGLEEAARRERFAALADVARMRGADAIALAHHQTDQAETLLLHLLRGTGLHGMSGMAEWSERPVPWWNTAEREGRIAAVAIWRPVLAEAKETLDAYVAGLALTPLDDPMNASLEFTRNRIRHQLLPLMEEISPGSVRSLVRYAQLASAEDAYLDSAADVALAALRGKGQHLRTARLSDLDTVLQRRIIRAWLHEALPIGVEVSRDRVDAVRALALSGRGGARIQVGSGWQVVRSGRYLTLVEEPSP